MQVTSSSVMRTAHRVLIPLCVLVTCAMLLRDRLAGVDMANMAGHWAAISTSSWLAALAFTGLSFWAVGRYDVVAHRHLGTGICEKHAARSGMAAIALAQTLGFGLISGALVRWRLLPKLGLPRAAAITGFVSATFLGALAVVTALACLFLPAPAHLTAPAVMVLFATFGAVLMLLRRPTLRLFGRRFNMPSIVALGATGFWAFVDVLAAGMALYMLIPAGAAPDLATFIPLFLLALGAALLLGTPGGVGPFELTLLALLSQPQNDAHFLTAIVAFRVIYYALPALMGLAYLALPNARTVTPVKDDAPIKGPLPRAECDVIRQNGGALRQIEGRRAALWPTAHASVALFDPSAAPDGGFFAALRIRARHSNRCAVIYKCSARSAARARKAGWVCLHLANDALLDPAAFTLQNPKRRQLRRKLRQAENAGISIREATRSDISVLRALDHVWQAQHGTARGGTMGRFCPRYLAAQRVFLAEQDGRPLAFISLHQGRVEWALDLMRHAAEIPAGTMHKLVLSAIETAADERIPALSLSAVQSCPRADLPWVRTLFEHLTKRSGTAGLHQFKAAFDPHWQPLYAAAPSWPELAVGLLDIAREVHDPRPMAVPAQGPTDISHLYDENYVVASGKHG